MGLNANKIAKVFDSGGNETQGYEYHVLNTNEVLGLEDGG
jgi:hypothetical protein